MYIFIYGFEDKMNKHILFYAANIIAAILAL